MGSVCQVARAKKVNCCRGVFAGMTGRKGVPRGPTSAVGFLGHPLSHLYPAFPLPSRRQVAGGSEPAVTPTSTANTSIPFPGSGSNVKRESSGRHGGAATIRSRLPLC